MFERLAHEPAALASAVRAVLYAVVAYGAHLSEAQIGTTMLAVEAVLLLFTRQSVVPTSLVQERVDEGRNPLTGAEK